MNNLEFVKHLANKVDTIAQKHIDTQSSIPIKLAIPLDNMELFDRFFSVRGRHDKDRYLLLDTDRNAFQYSTPTFPGIFMKVSDGLYLTYSPPDISQTMIGLDSRVLLFQPRNPSDVYDPYEFLTEEMHFQASTVLDIPSIETLREMLDIVEFLIESEFKFRCSMDYDDYQSIQIGRFYNYAMQE